jgi:hypothetical protein
MSWTPDHMKDQQTETPKSTKNPFKWVLLGVGGLVAIAHIGALGHMMKMTEKYADRPQYPAINLPTGEYSSYDVKVGKDGYEIRYNANDPKVLVTEKNLDLESHKKGFFGGTQSVDKTESIRKEYTMFNESNGGSDTEGKLTAEKLACIKSEGSGESTGAIVGASMTGGLAPVLSGIPYVGWLAAGWATMLGSKVGSDLGGEVAKSVSGC